jgi:hypothetical protein
MSGLHEIYDGSGSLVGFIDGDFIFDRATEEWVAYLSGELVYAGGAKVLGFLHDGFFRDLRGNSIAFVRGAKGAVLPDIQIAALDLVLPGKPSRPVAPVSPPMPPARWGWGPSWREFVEGIPSSPRW